jgi:hypothetical protein
LRDSNAVVRGIDTGSFSVKDSAGDEISMGNSEIYALTAAGAGWKVNPAGQVAIGGPSAELLDLFDQMLQVMDTFFEAISTETHLGNLGYPSGPPLDPVATVYTDVKTEMEQIKTLLNTIKGSL